MEPRKVANYFTLFTLHMIWLMGRGNISPSVIRFSFCCVCVCFSLGSHTYIFSSKNTVRMPGSSSHLQYSSSQSGFISSNIRGLQVGKIQFLSIRDTFQMSCLLPCLSPSWNGFGCPTKAQWVLGHSKRCSTVASNRKKIDFFFNRWHLLVKCCYQFLTMSVTMGFLILLLCSSCIKAILKKTVSKDSVPSRGHTVS